ncbi:HipA N-terminal domain-containing protein [Alcanivorax balearicus MACL04]|uniref:HipA N-terminal domain-containing protein n=1 Tax=Alloalcanivorax balearicus MACL04 TaxID=1177182 RepID=A0ABT2QYH6_9GAMM|nr:type II toxin-antitoxin system HipA family toxin [Alloalcanivorax balearicus]MCU5782576.1 HipA N-terminal domain-containing protein [Alloalcanivorax balearicus MACL04]
MSSALKQRESVEALSLTLHGQRVGIVSHYAGGKNILVFDPAFAAMPAAPVFTLSQTISKPAFQPRMASQRLPPVLSNLLPEGALRAWMSQALKVHTDNEFPLLAAAGTNLPGALVAQPIPAGEIPSWALSQRDRIEPVQINVLALQQKFSLAGVQMKFSASRQDGRMNIASTQGKDEWIIKTPSTVHQHVPANEYSAMKLAEYLGVTIPQVALLPLDQISGLPDIPLPDESLVYAIQRFDRSPQGRIHSEDFAQVFELYAHEKYGRRNYEQIAATIYHYGGEGLPDTQQMARRLLANILLANGDAHIKNWTLHYPDQRTARLAPAYDILTTLPYIRGETDLALNMGRERNWYALTLAHFQLWAERVGVPWPAVRVHLLDARDRAREHWPTLLTELPMAPEHKQLLRTHWRNLGDDFRIV